MIKYLIIDDETVAHDIIKGYCDMLPDMQLQQHCYDAIEALTYLKKHQVDLIFLDLNMPKLKGFDFLKTLTYPPKVIVTTAYQEYALEGYELNVVDYLLKPFSFERFLMAIQKATNTAGTASEPTQSMTGHQPNSIFLRSNKQYIQVNLADVLYLESAGNYVKLIMTEESILVRDKLSELSTKFPPDYLIKVHKSFAVVRSRIKRIAGNRIYIKDHELPIGKTYRQDIETLLGL